MKYYDKTNVMQKCVDRLDTNGDFFQFHHSVETQFRQLCEFFYSHRKTSRLSKETGYRN